MRFVLEKKVTLTLAEKDTTVSNGWQVKLGTFTLEIVFLKVLKTAINCWNNLLRMVIAISITGNLQLKLLVMK